MSGLAFVFLLVLPTCIQSLRSLATFRYLTLLDVNFNRFVVCVFVIVVVVVRLLACPLCL